MSCSLTRCVIGIKNELSAQLHKFMANLTDTRYKMQGKTVLYVPSEGKNITIEVAAKNKEFVQRLESKHFVFLNCLLGLIRRSTNLII